MNDDDPIYAPLSLFLSLSLYPRCADEDGTVTYVVEGGLESEKEKKKEGG